MSYITRMTLDKAEAVRKRLIGLYEWHKVAWQLFPGKPENQRDFLSRLDSKEHGFRFTVLSESKPQRPDWYPTDLWESREVPENFYKQKQYLFQLIANPTKTLSKRDPKGNKKENGSHYAIVKKEELYNWFLQKGDQNGFCILEEPSLDISPPVFNRFAKGRDEGTIIGVEFKGGLKVTDYGKFINAAKKGIGRARGFGFGMLVLRPIF